jgi:hypothetical protein
MSKTHSDAAKQSIDELFEIIEEHLLSLPEDEVTERLNSIDKAHATARASEARTPSRRSQKRSTRNGSMNQ